MTPEEYSQKLLALIKNKAEVMDFQDLYYLFFDKLPSDITVDSYKKAINPEAEIDESYSYEESYSYDYE